MWDPAGRPRKTHGTSARRKAQPVTEWTNTGLFLGGRLRSSIYCPQMGVPFWVRYEDRLFPSCPKSRACVGALLNGNGQQLSTRSGLPGWEFKLESLAVSPVYVNKKGSVIIPVFEYMSVCYVKLLEWAAVVEVCGVYHSFVRLRGGGHKE